jgi:hypothetical protein
MSNRCGTDCPNCNFTGFVGGYRCQPVTKGWFQVENGDIFAGSLTNTIPLQALDKNMNLKGGKSAMPYPGLITTANATTSFGNGWSSTLGWLAQSSPYSGIQYDFTTIKFLLTSTQVIPSDLCANTPQQISAASLTAGQPYACFSAPTVSFVTSDTFTNLNLTGNHVVFINGNLLIDKPLTFSNTQATLTLIVSGNVTINPTIGNTPNVLTPPSFQAQIIAQGTITVDNTPTVNKQVVIQGSLVGMQGITNTQTLTTPYEGYSGLYVVYDPVILKAVSSPLARQYMQWIQVPP